MTLKEEMDAFYEEFERNRKANRKVEWEVCSRCRHRVPYAMWSASPEIWAKIKMGRPASHQLCIGCFTWLARRNDVLLHWECRERES